MSSSFRTALENASEPALKRLATLPRAVPVLAVLGLLIAGGLVPGWGWVLTAVVLVFLGWMLLLSWPHLTSPERIMRLAVIALVLAVTVVQAVPRS